MSERQPVNLELQQIFYGTDAAKPREERFDLPGGRYFLVCELAACEIAQAQIESMRWRLENDAKADPFYEGRLFVRSVTDEKRQRVWADDQAMEVMAKPVGLIDPLMGLVARVNQTGAAEKDLAKKKLGSQSSTSSTTSPETPAA